MQDFNLILDTAIRYSEVALAATVFFGAIKHSFVYDAKRHYNQISNQLDVITAEARALKSEIDFDIQARMLALLAAAIIIVSNAPAATAVPALPGFQPAGLLVSGEVLVESRPVFYDSWTVKELRDECERRNIQLPKGYVKKVDLLARIDGLIA